MHKNNKLILKTWQRFKSERHNAFFFEDVQIMIKECNQLIR